MSTNGKSNGATPGNENENVIVGNFGGIDNGTATVSGANALKHARRVSGGYERTHKWRDENGRLAFVHRKKSDGSWGYAYRDENGETVYRKPPIAKRLMWNMADLVDALESGEDVWWCEGEKDADSLSEVLDIGVTTSVHQGGSAPIEAEQAEIFRGSNSRINLVIDLDRNGFKHAVARYEALREVGVQSGRLVLLAPVKVPGVKDLTDHLEHGLGIGDLRKLTITDVRKTLSQLEGDMKSKAQAKAKKETESVLNKVFEALGKVGSIRGSGQDWTCPHPAHEDSRPSFGVTLGRNGHVLLNCQACMPETGTDEHATWLGEILGVLGLEPSDITPESEQGAADKPKGSMAAQLVKIAQEKYRIGRTEEGKTFAVPIEGANIALFFGKGDTSLMEEVSAQYFEATGKVPSAGARSDATNVLSGFALRKNPEDVALRVGRCGDGSIAIDIGDNTGRAIVVQPGSWEVVPRSPILFRRTSMSLPYPEPERGGSEVFGEFRALFNVSDRDWDFIVSWLVTTFIPDIPHVALMIKGEQGTAKSSLMEMLSMIIDPTKVPRRKRPRDEEQWMVAANASWAVALDNLSHIPEWLSDALCRAITKDGGISRQLYTDDDVVIRSFRRVVLMNGIAITGVQNDLADRLFTANLKVISPRERKTEREVNNAFEKLRGRVFGALLDAIADTLSVIASGRNHMDERSRMADIFETLRAVDIARGTNSLEHYSNVKDRVLVEAAEEDPVFDALRHYIVSTRNNSDSGSFMIEPNDLHQLLSGVTPDPHAKNWPPDVTRMSARLTRLASAFRVAGIRIERGKKNGRRAIRIEWGPEITGM